MLELGSAVRSNPCQAPKRAHRKQIQTMAGPGSCPVLISTTALRKWGNWNSTIQSVLRQRCHMPMNPRNFSLF